jgi:hypothetical protein
MSPHQPVFRGIPHQHSVDTVTSYVWKFRLAKTGVLLKRFLSAHSGFDRNDMQGYLDLFSVAMNLIVPANYSQV